MGLRFAGFGKDHWSHCQAGVFQAETQLGPEHSDLGLRGAAEEEFEAGDFAGSERDLVAIHAAAFSPRLLWLLWLLLCLVLLL